MIVTIKDLVERTSTFQATIVTTRTTAIGFLRGSRYPITAIGTKGQIIVSKWTTKKYRCELRIKKRGVERSYVELMDNITSTSRWLKDNWDKIGVVDLSQPL